MKEDMKEAMKTDGIPRRELLGAAGGAVSVALLGAGGEAHAATLPRFRYCLNTSTIRGQKLGLAKEIEIAARSGYDAIEPWTSELRPFADRSGGLRELRSRLGDAGLTVESAIGFPRWLVNDAATRARGVEDMKREMGMLAEVGGKRIAAPPCGIRGDTIELAAAAERYRALLELGDHTGVVPQIEIWGSARFLSRLGEAVYVAVESGHPSACLLPDVYHIYKGGSAFEGLGLLGPSAVHVLHMNDYPADPPRERIGDGDRVLPGDGVAPITRILQILRGNGCRPVLSLELFSRKYWEQPALDVARRGIAAMKRAVAALPGK
jgi:sugar phosphate isomerase/epimerase